MSIIPQFRIDYFKSAYGNIPVLLGKTSKDLFTYEMKGDEWNRYFEITPYNPEFFNSRIQAASFLITDIFKQIDNEVKRQQRLKNKSYKTLNEYLNPKSNRYWKIKSMKYFNYIHEQIFKPYVEKAIETVKEARIKATKENQEQKLKEYNEETAKEREERLIKDYETNKELNKIYREAQKQKDKLDFEFVPELTEQRFQQNKPEAKPKEKEQEAQELTFTYSNTSKPPYRSEFKLKSLYKDSASLEKALKNVKPLNNFSIKENSKRYHLKACSTIRHTFIGDLFFQGRYFAYLLLINVNTRKAYFYTLHQKKPTKTIIDVDNETTTETYEYINEIMKDTNKMKEAFTNILKQTPINVLEFDGEKAIASTTFQNWLNRNNIKFIPLHPGSHTSTALMDRLCRTIRDIASNMGYEYINENIMKRIIDIYNNAPHKTLTKILYSSDVMLRNTFPNGISPNDVEERKDLETLFVENCLRYNALIKSSDDYELAIGDKVRIYNKNIDSTFPTGINKSNKRSVLSKEIYTVIGKNGNLFKIVDSLGRVLFKPRRDLAKQG